jgi:hypothetical protein
MTHKIKRSCMSDARRNALWREMNPEKWKAARERYYQKNRRAIIFAQRMRNAGLTPPPLAEIRKSLS